MSQAPPIADRSSAEPVDCSVLVPVLNEERYLTDSVAAMRRQRFDGVVEFVFADGGSSDRTRELLTEFAREDPRIRVFDNPKRSVSSGLNVALRHARGQWIARMDAHTEYPDDYLALGVQRLRRGGTRWVSGPQIPRGHGTVSRAVALALSTPLGRGGSRKWGTDAGSGEEYELDAGVFAGVWARETLLEYGGWDEHWPRNSDSEMAGRFLARNEHLICVPAMGAQYVPRDSLRGLFKQYLDYGEYRFKTARRHPDTLRRSHLLAPALVIDAALACVAPRPVRVAARAGLALYVAVLCSVAARSLPTAERRGDALTMIPVLALMHLGHGAGAIRGTARHGVPSVAFATAAGLRAAGPRERAEVPSAFSPSLTAR